jgi:plastocyanin
MSKLLQFAAAAAALVLMVGTGCKKNSAPEAPTVSGPTSARPGDSLTYRLDTVDPDGDSVFFMISWRGGDSTAWSKAIPSGEEYTQTHSYTDTGTYYIKAKAKDGKDAVSGWSDSIRVRIGSFPPGAPVRPTGPARCSTGLAYTWSTKASHPLHDSVRIQFSWGDGRVDSFGHMVASNTIFDSSHTYSLPGSYKIAARARDAAGFESQWSETLVVTVDSSSFIPPGSPTHLTLSAPTDSTVKITWLPPTDTTKKPISYIVRFKETGTANYVTVDRDTLLLLSSVHDPAHRTGSYIVAAVYANETLPSTEAPSTAPHRTSLTVQEFSVTGGTAGYGWNRTTGEASLYDMTIPDSASKIDLYFTDFALGFAGPNFYVASPDTAPYDPGGSVPNVFWHNTRFIHLDSLAGEDSILPGAPTSDYRKSSLLDSLPRFVAGHTTADDYYALLYVTAIDTINGTADIESWFQKIKGLRLVEH